jgi:hypothetical protein
MKVSHRITRLVLIALAVLALAAPVASARPAPVDTPTGPVEAPVVLSVDDGFDWASAAIGAGIAGGIVLLLVWGGVTYRHRREHIGVVN